MPNLKNDKNLPIKEGTRRILQIGAKKEPAKAKSDQIFAFRLVKKNANCSKDKKAIVKKFCINKTKGASKSWVH